MQCRSNGGFGSNQSETVSESVTDISARALHCSHDHETTCHCSVCKETLALLAATSAQTRATSQLQRTSRLRPTLLRIIALHLQGPPLTAPSLLEAATHDTSLVFFIASISSRA